MENLAFEIFEVEDGKKVKVRKIYFNGHIEGFEGDPCIVNHAIPYVGIMSKDLFRLQRICNLERSLVILTLDFKARSKELKEEIEKLRKGGNECSE